MPSYYFNERFYIVYNINLIMFYDLLIFIFMSYIKPQPASSIEYTRIVYSTIPTSNYNLCPHRTSNLGLYILLFLHQTTTHPPHKAPPECCISYYSYIKPQQMVKRNDGKISCISYYSYIKPQLKILRCFNPISCISYYSYIKPQLTEASPR